MAKLLNDEDKILIDNILKSLKENGVPEKNIKKTLMAQLDANPITSNWKFIKKYHTLKYLQLV